MIVKRARLSLPDRAGVLVVRFEFRIVLKLMSYSKKESKDYVFQIL